ncbi:MAG: hypothetical protein AB7F32_12920, partial [Victivallaceae bacterium]
QAEMIHASGAPRPSFAATLTGRPVVSFQTHNLGLLNAATALSSTGLTMSFLKMLATGEYDPAAAISYAAALGLAVPDQITAAAGQTATLGLSIYPVSSDGSSAPLAAGTTRSLPGLITGDIYTLGAVKIGDTPIGGVTNVAVNFGYNVVTNEGENGASYPTLARIDRHTPSVTVDFSDISSITAAHLLTGNLPAGAVTIYFSGVNQGAVTTPEVFSITLGKSFVDAASLKGGVSATGQLQFRPLLSASDFFAFAGA